MRYFIFNYEIRNAIGKQLRAEHQDGLNRLVNALSCHRITVVIVFHAVYLECNEVGSSELQIKADDCSYFAIVIFSVINYFDDETCDKVIVDVHDSIVDDVWMGAGYNVKGILNKGIVVVLILDKGVKWLCFCSFLFTCIALITYNIAGN